MMTNAASNKYICIVREEEFDKGIPLYARTRYSLQWTKPEILEEDFRELLFYLFDCDIAPELGEIPLYIREKLENAEEVCRTE